MSAIVVSGTYQDGVLKLDHKLDLPDNTLVRLPIEPLAEAPRVRRSLLGAFPELRAISDADIEEARRMWEREIEEQTRSMSEHT